MNKLLNNIFSISFVSRTIMTRKIDYSALNASRERSIGSSFNLRSGLDFIGREYRYE